MAAYGALYSLENVIHRHMYEEPGYLAPPKSSILILGEAYDQIYSTLNVLEILDDNLWSVMRGRSWELVESRVHKRFPCEYPIVRFACEVEPLGLLMRFTEVDASDIRRIRYDACRLQNLLQPLLSSLQQRPPLRLVEEMDTAKHRIRSFVQTVKKIKGEDRNKSKNMVRLCDAFRVFVDLLLEIDVCGREGLKYLEVAIRRLDLSRSNRSRMRVNALEVAIREKVCELEDLLEPPHLSNQFPMPFPMDQHEVIKYIPPFTLYMRTLEEQYIKEVITPFPKKGGDNDNIVSSVKFYGKKNSKMVGLYDEVDKIKTSFDNFDALEIVALFGMAGIGKTTVAKQVFEDQSILESFEIRVWVEVGQMYKLKRVKQTIIDQVLMCCPDNIDEILTEGGDEGLDEYLYQSLKDRRYLIVLDDVWEDEFCDGMIETLFPDDENGSRVLLTTRCKHVSKNRHRIRFLSKEESWILLHREVFGEDELCPPSLENAGKKIAESCDGLPLTIITIGKLLSKVEKTPEKWNALADNPNSLIEHAYDLMSDVLLPSCTYLSQNLKASFLYMGAFPCKYEISKSELFKLWVAERIPKFGEYDLGFNSITIGLKNNSLLLKRQNRSAFGIKTWCLHSSFWHLCKKEGMKYKFSYAISCLGDCLSGSIKNQRRLCIQKNILFCIKDAHKSMTSISTARSLLCTGPPHQYPVPICFSLKLLRILNALTIRLYEFPMEVLELFRLRYLALTCYGNLPSSISKLWNLELLIVSKHLIMGSSKAPSYLPAEIWDMKQLIHIQVMGSDLPTPCEGAFLPKLERLPDVSARSCNKCVFEGTPNLKKLGVRIELRTDGHATETLRCFDHIHHLNELVSLKCVIVNPTFGPHIAKTPLSVFPSTLKKLSLSGFGFPWEDMRLIAALPNLQVLKLRQYAFRGPELRFKDNEFPELIFLLIEDTDLVDWTIEEGSTQSLCRVFLKSCYNLENVTFDRSCFGTVVDCFKLKSNPFSVK